MCTEVHRIPGLGNPPTQNGHVVAAAAKEEEEEDEGEKEEKEEKEEGRTVEMNGMDQSPHIRERRRSHARQEQERQWIIGVMREFERRRYHRNANNKDRSASTATPFSSSFLSDAAASTATTPITDTGAIDQPIATAPGSAPGPGPWSGPPALSSAASRVHCGPQTSVSPKLSHGGEHEHLPSETSWVRRRRRRPRWEGGGRYRDSSRCFDAAGLAFSDDDELLWSGGSGGVEGQETGVTTSATVTAFSSRNSRTVSTTATYSGCDQTLRCSTSSCGACLSPVDLRNVGEGEVQGEAGGGGGVGGGGGSKGAPDPTSPRQSQVPPHDEEVDESPPRPRAFWREEWLEEDGGLGENGGRSESRRVHQSTGMGPTPFVARENTSLSKASEGGRLHSSPVGYYRRSCRRGYTSAGDDDGDDETGGGGGGGGREVGAAEYFCPDGGCDSLRGRQYSYGCGNGSDDSGGGGDHAWCNGDRVGKSDVREVRARLAEGVRVDRSVSRVEAERSLHHRTEAQGECTSIHFSSTDSDSSGTGGRKSRGCSEGGLSTVGFALLAAVTVAAFAVGTLVGPTHRYRPSAPVPSPSEYAPLLTPHPAYKPTTEEMIQATRERARRGLPTSSTAGGSTASTATATATTPPRAAAEATEAVEVAAGEEELSSAESRTDDFSDGAAPEGVVESAATTTTSSSEGEGRRVGAASPPAKGSADCQSQRWNLGGGPPTCLAPGEDGGEPPTVQTVEAPLMTGINNGHDGLKVESADGFKPTLTPLPGQLDGNQSASLPYRHSSPAASASTSAVAATAGSAVGDRKRMSEGRRRHRRSFQNERWTGSSRTHRRPRRRMPVAVGADFVAFAQTLGSAERSLAVFLGFGSDEEAELAAARRAAMSGSAARSACRLLAWSKAGSAVRGYLSDDDGGEDWGWGWGCDTDAAWRRNGDGEYVLTATPSLTHSVGEKGGDAVDIVEAVATGAAYMLHHRNLSGVEEAKHEARDFVPGSGKLGASSSLTAQDEGEREIPGGGRYRGVTDGGQDRRGPAPLLPRCRELALSGSDVRASWVGRYVLVEKPYNKDAVEGGLPGTGASSRSPSRVSPLYYCLQSPTPLFACTEAAAAATETEGGLRFPQGHVSDRQRQSPSVSLSASELAVPGPFESLAGRRESEGTSEAISSYRRQGMVGVDASVAGDESAGAAAPIAAMNPVAEPVLPDALATASADMTTPVLAKTEEKGRFSLGRATASTVNDEAMPESEPGPPQENPGCELLCLYWTDVGDGRWVLDDDLVLSNGVVGVTKGPAPASPELAFPSRQQQHPRCPSGRRGAAGVDEEALGGGDFQTGSGEEGGGTRRVGNACEAEDVAIGTTQPPTKGNPTWLLDSSEIQGWVEAEDLSVECVLASY